MAVMGGKKALKGVLLAAVVCGVSFAGVQFVISNYVGVQLTDILASLAAMGSLALLLQVWKPEGPFLPCTPPPPPPPPPEAERVLREQGVASPHHPAGEIVMAWMPYILLVIMVLVWGYNQTFLRGVSKVFNWPGLHNLVQIVPPVSAKPGPYAAVYRDSTGFQHPAPRA